MANNDQEQRGTDGWNGPDKLQRVSERRVSSLPVRLRAIDTRLSELRKRQSEGKGLFAYSTAVEIGMYEGFRDLLLAQTAVE